MLIAAEPVSIYAGSLKYVRKPIRFYNSDKNFLTPADYFILYSMTNSMTAFARSQALLEEGVLVWELRSVNHRYLDVQFKLPDTFRDLEPLLREKLKKNILRGKVECSLRLDRTQSAVSALKLNEALLNQLIRATDKISSMADNTSPVNPVDLLNWPGVIETREVNEDSLHKALLAQFDNTLDELSQTRKREGKELARLIKERLSAISNEIIKIRGWIPEILSAQRSKIISKIESYNIEPDRERLEQELVFLAQKTDVEEELDRIETHITEVERTLENDRPAGRRLDFLMQELNREANTLASKSINTQSTQSAIELKVLIEQMREQIQNIE